MKCEVCSISDSKYKCPNCRIQYCSINCFGSHKSKCIRKLDDSNSPEAKPEVQPLSSTLNKSIFYEVPKEKLEMLGHSKPLQYLLKNPHLRNILQMIDESPDPESIMHKAMQEPLFIEYVDVCMETLNLESS